MPLSAHSIRSNEWLFRWLAVTQMEPTDARRVLPCFDEPFYKAVFLVTIIHPSSLKALSNGMEERMEDLGYNFFERGLNNFCQL